MDAMKRSWRALRALLLQRPWIFILLALFYVVEFLVAAMVVQETRGKVIGFLSILPTAGIFAMATDRISYYCGSAGFLGLPDHARSVKAAQIFIIGLFALGPALLSWSGGLPAGLSMALSCACAALATLAV